MNRDVARKQPARIVDARPLAQPAQTKRMRINVEVHESADRWALLTDVHRAERRGLVRILTDAPVFNYTMGVWEMRVVRIKYPRPAWLRVFGITLAVASPLLLLVGAIWWVLLTFTAAALAALIAVVLLLLAGLVAAGRNGGSKTININIRQ